MEIIYKEKRFMRGQIFNPSLGIFYAGMERQYCVFCVDTYLKDREQDFEERLHALVKRKGYNKPIYAD